MRLWYPLITFWKLKPTCKTSSTTSKHSAHVINFLRKNTYLVLHLSTAPIVIYPLKGMAFTGILFACAVLSAIDLVTSIRCFNCAVTAEILTIGFDRIFTPSCSNFDGSPNYSIECPYSTMCSRIISTMHLQNGYEQKTLTLGCAQQKLLRHVLYKGKWKEEQSVQEIYSEDCKTMNDNNLASATRTYCYCRGDLCNSSYKHFVFNNVFNCLLPFLFIKIIF